MAQVLGLLATCVGDVDEVLGSRLCLAELLLLGASRVRQPMEDLSLFLPVTQVFK